MDATFKINEKPSNYNFRHVGVAFTGDIKNEM